MEKSAVLTMLLVQDRLIRLNIQMLEGILREIRADLEEINLFAEACLSEEEYVRYRDVILRVEAGLLARTCEVLDYIYDIYEVFNFDIAFLSTLPEELSREIERLDAVNSINSRLELIITALEEILLVAEESPRMSALLTPFRVYREVIKQGIEFNRRLGELSLQKTV